MHLHAEHALANRHVIEGRILVGIGSPRDQFSGWRRKVEAAAFAPKQDDQH
jgi:hypothetical protein